MYKEFENLVNSARKLNLKQQADMVRLGVNSHIGIAQYSYEYKTININVGRRVGKTNYVLNYAESCDLVICRNYSLKCNMTKELYPTHVEVWTQEEIGRKIIGNRYAFRDIYLDDCNMTTKQIDELYQYVFVSNQIIVFGTSY